VRFREGPPDLDVGIVPGEIVVDSTVLQLDGVDFAPGGGRVAGLQSTRDGAELIVLDEASGRVEFRTQLPGGSQVAWSGDDTVLVLEKTGSASRVQRCDLVTGECAVAERDLPPGGQFGYGLWLVARSFEGSSADGDSVSPSVALTTSCTQATSSGDFDGDGATDEAEFIEVVSGGVSCDRDGGCSRTFRRRRSSSGSDQARLSSRPSTTVRAGSARTCSARPIWTGMGETSSPST
jgi:hypothetical protein